MVTSLSTPLDGFNMLDTDGSRLNMESCFDLVYVASRSRIHVLYLIPQLYFIRSLGCNDIQGLGAIKGYGRSSSKQSSPTYNINPIIRLICRISGTLSNE